MKVDVVHIVDTIMERQLDRTASKMLQAALKSKESTSCWRSNPQKSWETNG